MRNRSLLFVLSLLLFAAACTPTKLTTVDDLEGFSKSSVNIDSVIARIPNYQSSLNAITGKGKAIVSEPGNTERVTVYFSGNRQKSMVTIKNALGIEGGQMLSEGDSLLIYNKVDKIARKISVLDGNVSSVGHLASINIVRMMSFTPGTAESVSGIYESDSRYLLALEGGGEVYVDKESYNIRQVDQPRQSGLPYSRIVYDAYTGIQGFILPRRVTIFGADAQSKVALLIQSLEVNPEDLKLEIDLPNDVKLVTQ